MIIIIKFVSHYEFKLLAQLDFKTLKYIIYQHMLVWFWVLKKYMYVEISYEIK